MYITCKDRSTLISMIWFGFQDRIFSTTVVQKVRNITEVNNDDEIGTFMGMRLLKIVAHVAIPQ